MHLQYIRDANGVFKWNYISQESKRSGFDQATARQVDRPWCDEVASADGDIHV